MWIMELKGLSGAQFITQQSQFPYRCIIVTTMLKKYKNEEEDRGSVLETSPLSFFFLVSAPFPPTPLPLTGQSKLCIKYPCKGFLLMAQK